jgi:hypothetical protein
MEGQKHTDVVVKSHQGTGEFCESAVSTPCWLEP